MWGYEIDRSIAGEGQVASNCKCSNEDYGSLKCGEFLSWLGTGWLIKNDSAPWSTYI